jgi:glucokinase
MILAADVGGTKCKVALFQNDGVQLRPVFQHRYLISDYACLSLEDVLQDFNRRVEHLDGAISRQPLTAACFGVAGAVVDGHTYSTNVPWTMEAGRLAGKLGLKNVQLINDVAATAFSLGHLGAEDLVVLNPGTPQPHANQALIAPGTGLGQAMLFWHAGEHHVAASEGGEADFTPSSDLEIELLRALKKRIPRVRCEDVLSGRGFLAIHEFLDPRVRHPSFDGGSADPAQEITYCGLSRSCEVCVRTLEVWAAAFGAEAGNLALRVLALGGIYLAGGIAVKMLEKIKDGTFFRCFCDKSNFAPILSRIPIYVIVNEDAPLWGAAYHALAASPD